MQNQSDRRRAPRVDVDIFVDEIHYYGRQLGRTMDISASGMRYLTDLTAPPRRGPDVFLELVLPDDPKPVQVLGEVVGSLEEQLYRSTSVRFTGLRSVDADRLRAYVGQRQAA